MVFAVGATLYKVANYPDPLSVPAQHAAAHFVFFKWFDFPAKERNDTGEGNVHGALAALATELQGAFDEVRDEVRAVDVQVGEVRAVGLVHVDVAFVEGGSGEGRDGGEEMRGGGVGGAVAEKMVVEGEVEAAMPHQGQTLDIHQEKQQPKQPQQPTHTRREDCK